MPVTLTDKEWAKITSLLLATTNGFSVQAKGAAMSAAATGELTQMFAEKNEKLKADLAGNPAKSGNREQRRAAKKKP